MPRSRMSTALDGTNGGFATSLQRMKKSLLSAAVDGSERARRRWPEGEDNGGEESEVPEPDRAVAGDAGPADSADTAMGSATRVWDQRGDPQSFRRDSAGGYRFALSGAAPFGKAEVDCGGVESVREQAAGKVLPTDGHRQEATDKRTVQVVSAFGRHRGRAAARGKVMAQGIHEAMKERSREAMK